jgi:hypothetical protein
MARMPGMDEAWWSLEFEPPHLLRTLLALAALGDTLVPLRSAWIELAWSFHGENELLGRACLPKSALSLVRQFQAMPWSG